jgi:ABC-type lipoprotein release transport system permease subunit
MLPVHYAIRNLFRDPVRLAQAVLGSGLVVLLMMGAAAFTAGMSAMLSNSGDPYNVILVGAGSEESLQRSEIPDQAAGVAGAAIPGIATPGGERAISPELHFMGYIQVGDREPVQILIRGITPGAFLTYPSVTLTEGRPPSSGNLIIGRRVWRTLGVPPEELVIGKPLTVDDQTFAISGIFAAPGTVMESEIWADLQDLRTLTQRESLSGVVIRLEEPDPADAQLFTTRRLDLELSAVSETEYYASLATFYAPFRTMVWITAGLIAVGALVGGFNTLYAAFASRIAELATLQTLGFSRPVILLSLVQESLMASLLGTLLSSLLAIGLLDGRVITFSMGTFTLTATPTVLLTGLVSGLVLGLLGALPPACRCLLPPLPIALRSGA